MSYERIPPATEQEKNNRELNDKVRSIPHLEGATDFLISRNSDNFTEQAFLCGYSVVEKSQSYMNLTAHPIWVTDRDNIPLCIMPLMSPGSPSASSMREQVNSVGEEFIIIQTLHYSADALRQIKSMFQKSTNPSRLMRYVHERSKNLPNGGLHGFTFTRLLRFKLSEFRKNDKGLYSHDGDVWMSADQNSTAHPFADFNALKALDQLLDIHALTRKLGLVVDFVLNSPVPAQRFFTFLGRVYEITSKPDPVRENGIYVYQTKDAVGVVKAVDIVEEFTPYDELIENQNFYTTANDAKTMGNSEGLFKAMETRLRMSKLAMEEQKIRYEAENTTSAQELERLKQDNRRLDEDNKRIAADREKQITELKHTHSLEIAALTIQTKREEVQLDSRKTTREIERDAIKDHYDQKQMLRKDVSEGTKFAYGIATAAFGFVVALGTWLVTRMGKSKAAAGIARLLFV